MILKKFLFWRSVYRWYKRWRTGIWFNRLRKMLFQMDQKLKNAEYTRHERRRILHALIKDIQGSLSTWLSKEGD